MPFTPAEIRALLPGHAFTEREEAAARISSSSSPGWKTFRLKEEPKPEVLITRVRKPGHTGDRIYVQYRGYEIEEVEDHHRSGHTYYLGCHRRKIDSMMMSLAVDSAAFFRAELDLLIARHEKDLAMFSATHDPEVIDLNKTEHGCPHE